MKKILMIATGGTIASMPGDVGLAPGLTGEELAAYVPEAAKLAELDVVQPMNIDSTNMRPSNWLDIARTIMGSYDAYDGFVVLHGTDTMAYTAAALSYLIQGSPKPIVLTGSQQPMTNPFTDARLNLYQSVLYAADDLSRDVSIVFGGQVIVGTRAHKQRTMSFNAFNSVNFPLPAIIRAGRIVRDGAMGMAITSPGETGAAGVPDAGARRDTSRRPLVYDSLNERVIVLRLTPGLSPNIFALLKDDFDAIVLETFGIGGIPEYENASFERAIFDWVETGHTLALTTQVSEEGLDLGVYEVGRAYAEHPDILKGDDMTTEALVAKTMWALGQTRDPETVRELFYRPVNHDRQPR
ncbi:MAG: asparaginase [Olsenella sp.]|nr:asparaginase [Olsenella sp.]